MPNAVLKSKKFFAERATRAKRGTALAILRKAGAGNAPVKGDELPKARTRK